VYRGQRRTAYEFTIVIERDGVRKRIRRAFSTRAEATDALDALREETRRPTPVPESTTASISLSEAFERYFRVKARKRTLILDRRIARSLQEEFGSETLLTSITASVISEYKARRLAVTPGARVLSAAAINRPLQLLRHLLRLAAQEWEILPAAPRIRLEREPQGRLRWLTTEEATRLLAKCREQANPDLVDLVELAIYTGMRRGELLGLSWADVDRSRGVILLEVTKSGRRREVPLCRPADAILARRAEAKSEGLVFGTASWYAFRDYWLAGLAASRLKGLHFHDLRHTFASWAMQKGASLPELQALLGHQTLAMTMRYAHLAPEHLRAAVSRLDNVLSVPVSDPVLEEVTR